MHIHCRNTKKKTFRCVDLVQTVLLSHAPLQAAKGGLLNKLAVEVVNLLSLLHCSRCVQYACYYHVLLQSFFHCRLIDGVAVEEVVTPESTSLIWN